MTPRGDGVGGKGARSGFGDGAESRDVKTQILDAALSVLASEGLDALTLPRIAHEASVSTGPLYSRWDSGEDVAVDLWAGVLSEHLRVLVGLLDAAMGPDDALSGAARLTLAEEMSAPSVLTLALTEVLLVFRRFPWLNSSIGSEVDDAFMSYVTGGGDTEPAYRLGQLDVVLGTLCFGSILTGLHIDWSVVLDGVRSCLNGSFDPALDTGASQRDDTFVYPLPMPNIRTGETIVDSFLAASCTVMARAGYARTSAHRISREAGYAFSHIYKYFDTKDDLTTSVVLRVLSDFRYRAVRSLNVHDPAEYMANVMGVMRGLWLDQSLPSSRLRLEMTAAARHNPQLADALREGILDTWNLTLGRLADGTSPARAHMNMSIALYGLGLAVLALACPSVHSIDMRPLVCAWAVGMDTVRTEMGIPLKGGTAPGATDHRETRPDATP